MIDRKWMNEFAYEVKRCPKCHQNSFCLIFESEEYGKEWECADLDCGYNPHCACPNCK